MQDISPRSQCHKTPQLEDNRGRAQYPGLRQRYKMPRQKAEHGETNTTHTDADTLGKWGTYTQKEGTQQDPRVDNSSYRRETGQEQGNTITNYKNKRVQETEKENNLSDLTGPDRYLIGKTSGLGLQNNGSICLLLSKPQNNYYNLEPSL